MALLLLLGALALATPALAASDPSIRGADYGVSPSRASTSAARAPRHQARHDYDRDRSADEVFAQGSGSAVGDAPAQNEHASMRHRFALCRPRAPWRGTQSRHLLAREVPQIHRSKAGEQAWSMMTTKDPRLTDAYRDNGAHGPEAGNETIVEIWNDRDIRSKERVVTARDQICSARDA